MKRIVLFLYIIIFSYCTDEKKKVDLKFNRFEKKLFEISSANVDKIANELDSNFGTFNDVFATQIMNKGSLKKTEYYSELLAFTQHIDMREAYDSVLVLYSDFSKIEAELELAFSNVSIFFPSYQMPEITTFFGGFNYGVITYDNNIAIGLENFLGKNSKYYSLLGDPQYLRFQKQSKFIVPNVLEVWFNDYFKRYNVGTDLLSQLIYKGKVMYFIDKILPKFSMRDKFRFTYAEMEWVKKNEKSIWQYIVHEDLLFSKQYQRFTTYINYAPFSKGMPQESPGRVGYYLGYMIVCEYIDNNPIDLEDLVYLTDHQEFLKKSKYKPKK